jgi:catechol 2,3-dioxygenase-like lactoylglutathione lyase family enzyme
LDSKLAEAGITGWRQDSTDGVWRVAGIKSHGIFVFNVRMESVMKFLGVDHIDIIVSDLKRSIEYYRKFGMHPEGTVDDGETVFLWNGDNDRPVRIELHKQQEGQTLGVDHLSFLVDDPIDAQKEIEFIGGVDFLFEPFENQQSGRTISNNYDPDGLQIQMARQTSPGTFKNWE